MPTKKRLFSLQREVEAGRIVVTERGILAASGVELMRINNTNAFLVGEAFMRTPSLGQALAGLFAE